MRAEFFLAEIKAQREQGGGRILLGENTGGGRSCCGRSGFSVLEFGFQMDSLVSTNALVTILFFIAAIPLCGSTN